MSLNFAAARSKFWDRLVQSAPLGRREIFLWVTLALVSNELLQLIDAQSSYTLIASLSQQNYILWLAGYVFVFRIRQSSRDPAADGSDMWFGALTCLAIFLTSFLPHRWGLGFISTGAAAYILLNHRGDQNLKAAGGVLLAISTYLIWGPILFHLVTPEVVRGDAAIVGGLLKLLRSEVLAKDTSFIAPDGFQVVLVGACSSFQNISTALLACAAITMLSRPEWLRGDAVTIALATMAMVLINAGRICLLASSAGNFAYWHDGDGVNIISLAQTAVVIAIAAWGAWKWRREENVAPGSQAT